MSAIITENGGAWSSSLPFGEERVTRRHVRHYGDDAPAEPPITVYRGTQTRVSVAVRYTAAELEGLRALVARALRGEPYALSTWDDATSRLTTFLSLANTTVVERWLSKPTTAYGSLTLEGVVLLTEE